MPRLLHATVQRFYYTLSQSYHHKSVQSISLMPQWINELMINIWNTHRITIYNMHCLKVNKAWKSSAGSNSNGLFDLGIGTINYVILSLLHLASQTCLSAICHFPHHHLRWVTWRAGLLKQSGTWTALSAIELLWQSCQTESTFFLALPN